jgi:Integrase core domain
VLGLNVPGVRASKRLISARFVWCGCASDVAEWCRCCIGCGRSKPGGERLTPVEAMPIPAEKFSHVHVDIVGPLPASAEGHTHLLTVVDRTTRWPEAFPLKSISARDCADSFVSGWVARFGVPLKMTMDRGVQFTSEVWAALCSSLGITHNQTSAYHPQSNGMVERMHRQLKEALRARQCGNQWLEHLPWALLWIRAAPKDSADISAAEAVYEVPLTLPGQATRAAGAAAAPRIPSTVQPEEERAADEIASGLVYVRWPQKGPTGPVYDGPYQELQQREKVVLVQLGSRADWVSRDRLKLYKGGDDPEPARRRGRGRPRKK